MERTVVEMVAIDDPAEVKANNPIHGSGAQAAGYAKPIVGGVSSYAWAIAAVVELLGDGWLDFGWADYTVRRPVYVGDLLHSTATIIGEGVCEYAQHNADGKVTIEGRAGVGLAGWHGEWQLPSRRDPVPATVPAPLVLPQDAPVDEDFPPMAFELTPAEAEAWAAVRMGDDHLRYWQGDGQRVHPSWLPAQYVPLVRHSFRQPDVGIHVSGRVQQLRPLKPAQFVLAGRWTMHEQRKERWWSATHGVLLDSSGNELAYFGQEAILLPPFEPE